MAIAYEPVWAIGTGQFATPVTVKAAIDHIRRQITALYGKKASQMVRVLYGGSVGDQNAADFMALPGVNGLLVGGSSLRADAFAGIVAAAHNRE